jgi:5-methylcytosine-specific restriction protein A
MRDNGVCQSPLQPPICIGKPSISLDKCQIDHINRRKPLDNRLTNLRTLCPVCHALRLDAGHRGLTGKLLRKDLLPANWREMVWE